MKCPRCQGLVVRDQLFDPEGPSLHIAILRCLNCGGTTYVAKNHQEQMLAKSSATRSGSKAA